MSVVIVDYGSGNLRSVAKAFQHVAGPDARIMVSADPADIATAGHIVLPGVGAFGDCMSALQTCDGMVPALEDAVIAAARPTLGICVGMQVMADTGEEHGRHNGLGWLGGQVMTLQPNDPACKVPHMGWNRLTDVAVSHPVLRGVGEGAYAYFANGYCLRPNRPDHDLAGVDHGGRFCAIVGHDNIIGVQFHPEKSQTTGLRLLADFIAWKP